MQEEQESCDSPTSKLVIIREEQDMCSNASSESIAQEDSSTTATNNSPDSCSTSTVSSSDHHPQQKRKPRRNPAVLVQWIEEHQSNPYPTKSEKQQLATLSGTTLRQLNDWFANARRNIKKFGYNSWRKKKAMPGLATSSSSSGRYHRVSPPNITANVHHFPTPASNRYSTTSTNMSHIPVANIANIPSHQRHPYHYHDNITSSTGLGSNRPLISASKISPHISQATFPSIRPTTAFQYYSPAATTVPYTWGNGISSGSHCSATAIPMTSCPYSPSINMGYIPSSTTPLSWNPVSLSNDHHWTATVTHHHPMYQLEMRQKFVDATETS